MEKLKTHILGSKVFSENRAVCEIMWKDIVETSRPQMTIRRMPVACWIPEATNSQTECVTHCFCTATIVERKRLKECYTALSAIL